MKHNTGFTLIELIVTVAAIAIISTVLSQIFFTTLRTNAKTEILKEVKQNGDLVQESMVRMIQNAQGLVSSCDAVGVESASLELINQDGNTTTLTCIEDEDGTRIASVSAASTDFLTSAAVTLGGVSCDDSTLTFVCKGGVGVRSSVTISFSLAQKGTSPNQFDTASSNFQTSATTRNVQQ
jgi:prepilin-type N-terminal cleavage/methylation domain-containing protein